MSVRKGPWLTAVVGALVVAAVAVVGSWTRRPGQGCALDGARIDPIYRVEVIDRDGGRHEFCCLTCARIWLRRQPAPPRAITVTDEASGEPINAADACYVSSFVVTNPATGNRVHAFRDRADAEKHAKGNGGIILTDSEDPLRQEP